MTYREIIEKYEARLYTKLSINFIIAAAIVLGLFGGWYIGEVIQGGKEEVTEPNCLGDNNLLREEK